MNASMQGREQAMETLREMMSEVLKLRSEGGSYARLTQATGRLDGYAEALVDLGLFTDREILSVVRSSRRDAGGPATAAVTTVAA